MRVLMMIVMENGVRLPWLPPMCLERDARMIEYRMIVRVQADRIEHGPMQWHHKDRHHQRHLHMHNFHRMYGRHRKGRRLLVLVM